MLRPRLREFARSTSKIVVKARAFPVELKHLPDHNGTDLRPVRARGLGHDAGSELGSVTIVVPFDLTDPQNTIETALKTLMQQGRLRSGSTVVIIGLIMVGEQIVDAVQMRVM